MLLISQLELLGCNLSIGKIVHELTSSKAHEFLIIRSYRRRFGISAGQEAYVEGDANKLPPEEEASLTNSQQPVFFQYALSNQEQKTSSLLTSESNSQILPSSFASTSVLSLLTWKPKDALSQRASQLFTQVQGSAGLLPVAAVGPLSSLTYPPYGAGIDGKDVTMSSLSELSESTKSNLERNKSACCEDPKSMQNMPTGSNIVPSVLVNAVMPSFPSQLVPRKDNKLSPEVQNGKSPLYLSQREVDIVQSGSNSHQQQESDDKLESLCHELETTSRTRTNEPYFLPGCYTSVWPLKVTKNPYDAPEIVCQSGSSHELSVEKPLTCGPDSFGLKSGYVVSAATTEASLGGYANFSHSVHMDNGLVDQQKAESIHMQKIQSTGAILKIPGAGEGFISLSFPPIISQDGCASKKSDPIQPLGEEHQMKVTSSANSQSPDYIMAPIASANVATQCAELQGVLVRKTELALSTNKNVVFEQCKEPKHNAIVDVAQRLEPTNQGGPRNAGPLLAASEDHPPAIFNQQIYITRQDVKDDYMLSRLCQKQALLPVGETSLIQNAKDCRQVSVQVLQSEVSLAMRVEGNRTLLCPPSSANTAVQFRKQADYNGQEKCSGAADKDSGITNEHLLLLAKAHPQVKALDHAAADAMSQISPSLTMGTSYASSLMENASYEDPHSSNSGFGGNGSQQQGREQAQSKSSRGAGEWMGASLSGIFLAALYLWSYRAAPEPSTETSRSEGNGSKAGVSTHTLSALSDPPPRPQFLSGAAADLVAAPHDFSKTWPEHEGASTFAPSWEDKRSSNLPLSHTVESSRGQHQRAGTQEKIIADSQQNVGGSRLAYTNWLWPVQYLWNIGNGSSGGESKTREAAKKPLPEFRREEENPLLKRMRSALAEFESQEALLMSEIAALKRLKRTVEVESRILEASAELQSASIMRQALAGQLDEILSPHQ